MSIAQDLQNTADFLAGWDRHKKPMPHATAGLLAEKMLALADRVKRLESTPMRLESPEVRLGFHKLRERLDAR